MVSLFRRRAVLFEQANGLLWAPEYLGYRQIARFVRESPECTRQDSSWIWWAGDWYIDFLFEGSRFRADVPLSDAEIHYPENAPRDLIERLHAALQRELGVTIRPGPPPQNRREWYT